MLPVHVPWALLCAEQVVSTSTAALCCFALATHKHEFWKEDAATALT